MIGLGSGVIPGLGGTIGPTPGLGSGLTIGFGGTIGLIPGFGSLIGSGFLIGPGLGNRFGGLGRVIGPGLGNLIELGGLMPRPGKVTGDLGKRMPVLGSVTGNLGLTVPIFLTGEGTRKLGFEIDFDDLENDFDDLEIFDPTLFEAELNFRPTLNWAWADVADSDRQSAAAIRLVDVLWNTG